MKPQDGSPQQGEDLTSAGFLARTRGVFFPQAGVALPMIFVLHRPVAPKGLGEPDGASVPPVETGDEVAGLAFEFIAFPFDPFADDPDKLARAGKEADVPVQINAGKAAALDATVVFFPVADPLVWNGGGEAVLGEAVKGGLVVLEP